MKRNALLLAAFAVLVFAAVVSTGVLEPPRGVPEHIGIEVSAHMRRDSYDVTLENGDVITIEEVHQPHGLGAPPPVGALVLAGSRPRPWLEWLGKEADSTSCPSAFPYLGDFGTGEPGDDGYATFRYGLRLRLGSGFVNGRSSQPGTTLYPWVCLNEKGEVGKSSRGPID